MNVISEIQRINQLELEKGLVGTSASWHAKYEDSAWMYAGNLPLNLTEGDVICILSQFGEIEDINLVRDDDTGKSRGFAFVKYEDSRSCILAVDNFAGTKVLGRSLRVDHCEKYRLPKELLEKEEARRTGPGHAYQGKDMANDFSIEAGQDLFAKPIERRPASKDVSKESKRKRREERNQIRKEHQEKRHLNPNDDSNDSKRKRKEERSQIRKEREEKRQMKEEKRRQKRSKRDFDSDGDDGKRKRHKKDR